MISIIMTSFTYIYRGEKFMGNYIPGDRGDGRVKVLFHDHSAHIMQTAFQTKDNLKIWVQCVQTGEAVWPHELIQAMGDGIEQNWKTVNR
jgi:hypothetical protein